MGFSVAMIRKLAGHTMPSEAELGTIRGDFSVDSAAVANREKRAVYNLIHASETEDEAKHEMKHWFRDIRFRDWLALTSNAHVQSSHAERNLVLSRWPHRDGDRRTKWESQHWL